MFDLLMRTLLESSQFFSQAHDQPDVFETNDLPESDQHGHNDNEDTSDAVETLHLSANEAFGKFKGKQVRYKVLFLVY